MYNKLFTKILDSSIWLAPSDTRIVWITFLAAMDEDGIVRLATVRNVAHRAMVPIESAQQAIEILESPDPETPECPYMGRRIERVPGGWLVLKAGEYREMVSRQSIREQTRQRVAKFRDKDKDSDAVSVCNAPVTQSDQIRSDQSKGERGAKAPTPPKKGTKVCPESWKPSEALLAKIAAEEVPACLARGGTTVEMELERMRSCTFGTARFDWDRTAWNWLLTECKKINQKEVMYGANRQTRR